MLIEIYIDYNYWKNASDRDRKLLIFHELGHDVLNLNHSSNPCHFMYSRPGGDCQANNLMNHTFGLEAPKPSHSKYGSPIIRNYRKRTDPASTL